ncbi:Oidioi.mRNA.OKI2018_I69.PAR.g9281.t1.cds [Oikopleura dioica]|uniref:Oidioi.mRNA.OKI2018_I69.PAR.g9281.t1.cds n=1 Tax=Oikopleura dioica TaxID=34765 RepID=A0ABN7RJW6_OIKDI|nr:Oidioi.mRNA.OKI2018_I69.PAR.g9281.t1.cds [Oikopleura dioica]
MGDSGVFTSNNQIPRDDEAFQTAQTEIDYDSNNLRQTNATDFYPRNLPVTQAPRPRMQTVQNLTQQTNKMSLKNNCQGCSEKDMTISKLQNHIQQLEATLKMTQMSLEKSKQVDFSMAKRMETEAGLEKEENVKDSKIKSHPPEKMKRNVEIEKFMPVETVDNCIKETQIGLDAVSISKKETEEIPTETARNTWNTSFMNRRNRTIHGLLKPSDFETKPLPAKDSTTNVHRNIANITPIKTRPQPEELSCRQCQEKDLVIDHLKRENEAKDHKIAALTSETARLTRMSQYQSQRQESNPASRILIFKISIQDLHQNKNLPNFHHFLISLVEV